MPTPVVVETWTCGDKTEVHFFRDDEVNTYVFGYNPELLSEAQAHSILAHMGHYLPDR